MDIESILEKARSTMQPELVYGAPHEQDGVIVIPASRVSGAGGGDEENGGGGGGYAVPARPAGALVIEPDGRVKWKVPFDLNRVILGGPPPSGTRPRRPERRRGHVTDDPGASRGRRSGNRRRARQ